LRNGKAGLSFPRLEQSEHPMADIATMRASRKASLTDGQQIVVSGHTRADDGGGGTFVWQADSSTPVDGGLVFDADERGPGRWKRIYSGPVDSRWFGARGDGTANDAPAINAAIAAGKQVTTPAGTYRCTTAIMPVTNSTLGGHAQDRFSQNNPGATVIESSAARIIDLGASGTHTAVLHDLHLKPVTPDRAGSYGLYGVNPTFLKADDVVIRDLAVGVYMEKSQQHTYRRCYIRACGRGMHFAAQPGTYNVDWFNNLISIEDSTIIASSAGPNIDFQGQGLHLKGCDISGIANSGTRASVRIRANSQDVMIESFYFEPATGQRAGGDVFLCQGGTTRINGGFCSGGAPGARVANVVRASGGAIVIVEGIKGYDYFDALVSADGEGTLVYVMPGSFSGPMAATRRFVQTNGGKVIELSLDEGEFPVTLAGCTTTPTGTVRYSRHGRVVTLLIPGLTGTSNSMAAILTGLPAALRPGTTQFVAGFNVVDNGVNYAGGAQVTQAGEVRLFKASTMGTTLFATSGVKGIQGTQVLHYTLY